MESHIYLQSCLRPLGEWICFKSRVCCHTGHIRPTLLQENTSPPTFLNVRCNLMYSHVFHKDSSSNRCSRLTPLAIRSFSSAFISSTFTFYISFFRRIQESLWPLPKMSCHLVSGPSFTRWFCLNFPALLFLWKYIRYRSKIIAFISCYRKYSQSDYRKDGITTDLPIMCCTHITLIVLPLYWVSMV